MSFVVSGSKARLEALELRKNPSIQITVEKSLGDKMIDVMPVIPRVTAEAGLAPGLFAP